MKLAGKPPSCNEYCTNQQEVESIFDVEQSVEVEYLASCRSGNHIDNKTVDMETIYLVNLFVDMNKATDKNVEDQQYSHSGFSQPQDKQNGVNHER